MKNLVLSAILTCSYGISHAQKDELIPENYEVYNQLTAEAVPQFFFKF